MTPTPARAYITTPIYYVNDRPHIGHCYTTVIADVAARFHRLLGHDTFLLTGTDEHADKVVTSAAAHNTTPQAWADQNAAEFRKAFAFMGVSNDDFIRTTEPRHKEKVTGYIQRLLASKDIYRGEYTGWYDEGQEEYLTETAAKEANFHSPINKKPLVRRTEPCYFFKLSAYQDRLLKHIEGNPGFVRPDSRRQEVLGRLRQGLNDVPVSRPVTSDPATQWGIRIPGDDANRVYVWIDALFNYLSVVDTPDRRAYWPAAVHYIGKDILWFHAVIWPALLMALGEPLPGCVFGHGWWISEGEKMSKSLGNFIDLEKLRRYTEKFGLDAVRWYLTTQGPLSGGDADFSHAKFVETFNSQLANGIGNCASRVGNMIEKYFEGVVPDPAGKHTFSGNELELRKPPEVPVGAWLQAGFDWPAKAREQFEHASVAVAEGDVGGALFAGRLLAMEVDAFINITAPFKLAKKLGDDPSAKQLLGTILYNCAEAVRIASILMSPALTTKIPQLWQTWNCTPPADATLEDLCVFGGKHALRPGQKIAKGDILYMRADAAQPAP